MFTALDGKTFLLYSLYRSGSKTGFSSISFIEFVEIEVLNGHKIAPDQLNSGVRFREPDPPAVVSVIQYVLSRNQYSGHL